VLTQWRTEEGIGGLEPLPFAYDLRNKRVNKRQNMVFSTKNTKKIGDGGTAPSTVGRGMPLGPYPPPRRLRHLDPSHSKILGTPLCGPRRFWGWTSSPIVLSHPTSLHPLPLFPFPFPHFPSTSLPACTCREVALLKPAKLPCRVRGGAPQRWKWVIFRDPPMTHDP